MSFVPKNKRKMIWWAVRQILSHFTFLDIQCLLLSSCTHIIDTICLRYVLISDDQEIKTSTEFTKGRGLIQGIMCLRKRKNLPKEKIQENCCSLWQNQNSSAFQRDFFMIAVACNPSDLCVLTQKLLKTHVCSLLTHLPFSWKCLIICGT